MSILKVYTVYDSAAGLWLKPMYFVSKGQAVRAFSTAANDATHEFAKFASDYTLFYVGEYDESTGRFDMLKAFEPIGSALEFRHDKDSVEALRRERSVGVDN